MNVHPPVQPQFIFKLHLRGNTAVVAEYSVFKDALERACNSSKRVMARFTIDEGYSIDLENLSEVIVEAFPMFIAYVHHGRFCVDRDMEGNPRKHSCCPNPNPNPNQWQTHIFHLFGLWIIALEFHIPKLQNSSMAEICRLCVKHLDCEKQQMPLDVARLENIFHETTPKSPLRIFAVHLIDAYVDWHDSKIGNVMEKLPRALLEDAYLYRRRLTGNIGLNLDREEVVKRYFVKEE